MVAFEVPPIEVSELPGLFRPLDDYDDIFLAVSGGADSTALMHLVARWCAEFDNDVRVIVLSVDHGLRLEAAAESRSVAEQAKELGFSADVLTWKGPSPKAGVQQAARDIRYRLMAERMQQAGGRAVLVTAHHRDDLAETLLMRMARGAGVDGLSALVGEAQLQGVPVLRPLIEISKARLIATLNRDGVGWFEDPSNCNREFERVRVRGATEAREALGLSDDMLLLTSRRMGRARRALESWIDQLLVPKLDDELLLRTGCFAWSWPMADLEDEIGIRLLQRVLPAIAGQTGLLRLTRIERLWERMKDPGFRGATLGGCRVGAVDKSGHLLISKEAHRHPLPAVNTNFANPILWDSRFEISFLENQAGPLHVRGCHRIDLQNLNYQGRLPVPIEALEATPVIVAGNGDLASPALDVQSPGAGHVFDGLMCRFRTEGLKTVYRGARPPFS